MTSAELRALTAQGPAVILASREDMLRLLDEREAYRTELARLMHAAGIHPAIAELVLDAMGKPATPSAPADRLAPVTGWHTSLNSPGAPASGAFSGEEA